ncbi:hypothetical protein FB45DRAFT_887108 [Roridomyces roridus]|uniref:Uncharacterized protein n=1 Tax=Roridomyces roridus TaxID=1738132 RepID=A0AAD7CJ02_9AGAR|nr:hypothetical protein FB45DRAFT_887108 [Roridomyces roridus]
MDLGETSPLLSGTPTPTINDSDTESYYPRDSRANIQWLVPVAIATGLCNALTIYSRNLFFRQFFCEELGRLPDTPDPTLQSFTTTGIRLDCSPYPSGMTISVAPILVTCVLSGLSTGWWSALGDLHGRRYPLIASIVGSILLNLVCVVFATTPALENLAQPFIFAGIVFEALLGGSATFNGALHAYAADVSPAGSWSTVFSVLRGLLVLCTVLGNWIGFGTDFIRPFFSFSLALAIGSVNLVFVFFFLPESLPESSEAPAKLALADVKQSMYSVVTLFLNGHRLAFFGLACLFYSLTMNLESFQLLFVLHRDPAMPFSAGLFMTLGVLLKIAALLVIFPAIIHTLKQRSPLSQSTSTKPYLLSVITIDSSAARYSVLASLLSQLLVMICPEGLPMMFSLLITPLVAGIRPALYAVTAVYSEVLGRTPQRGVQFGALSVISMVGETLSYLMYVPAYNTLWRFFPQGGFMLTAALLALVAIFLWPSESERIPPRDGAAERIRIIVSDDVLGHDAETAVFSPVYRRHNSMAPHSTDGLTV